MKSSTRRRPMEADHKNSNTEARRNRKNGLNGRSGFRKLTQERWPTLLQQRAGGLDETLSRTRQSFVMTSHTPLAPTVYSAVVSVTGPWSAPTCDVRSLGDFRRPRLRKRLRLAPGAFKTSTRLAGGLAINLSA